MSIFIDTLVDENGKAYEYGHCYQDYDSGPETGCGMEYAWYPERELLDRWHDGVGLVTTVGGFTRERRDALDREHDACHPAAQLSA